ncbi:MAG: sulfhydrogenase subunit delta [Legionellales bacterium]|nr:sulfhydrogenase subunit delta [Legionellales bacterium]
MKPKIAVYKFTSCDGCQLAFLNMGIELVALQEMIEIIHFPEFGISNPNISADIAFIEGSISTPQEKKRIQAIRHGSRFLITIGACATAGGIQALRNFSDVNTWVADIYPHPASLSTLKTSTAISHHVKVDFELWGCPVNSAQILNALKSLLMNATPTARRDSVCMECKRQGHICVMVTKNIPCMGPVTQTGCGAICPHAGRDCYGCYGPSENPNSQSLSRRFSNIGLSGEAITRRFRFINNQAPAFLEAGNLNEKKSK